MTFSESHPHLNVLNDERYSSYQLRIVHNVGINIFFINCTAELTCKAEFNHLVEQSDGTSQCVGCRKNYPYVDEPTTLRHEDLSDYSLEDSKLSRWVAAWLGVEPRHVQVAVSP